MNPSYNPSSADDSYATHRNYCFSNVDGDITTEEYRDQWNSLSSSHFFKVDVTEYLHVLPPLEAEIVWLLYVNKKNQKEISEILNLSQSTASYRLKRALEKLEYLILLSSVDFVKLIGDFTFLRQKEKEVLADLFRFANQDLVGRTHGVRQSTVKWIFTKSLRNVIELEKKYPDQWRLHASILFLLEKNILIRIRQEGA